MKKGQNKKFLELVTRIQWGGVKAVQKKSKVDLLWIFAKGGGRRVKLESKPFKALFEGPNPNLLRNFFSLSLDIFPKKGWGGGLPA